MSRSNDRAGTSRRDELLLAAFLTVTGLHLGAGLYEARVVIPQWAAVPTPAEVGPALHSSGHLTSGRVFWPYTGVPILLLTTANLRAAWRSEPPRRNWWLAASTTAAAASLATLGYFIPTLHQLTRAQTLPEPSVRALASQWVRLDRLRLTLGLGGWLAGLTALSQPPAPHPDRTPM
ncbi:MAG TPA: hypothetical protein VIY28_17000 [Pseudonocardiaceae bacterium]